MFKNNKNKPKMYGMFTPRLGKGSRRRTNYLCTRIKMKYVRYIKLFLARALFIFASFTTAFNIIWNTHYRLLDSRERMRFYKTEKKKKKKKRSYSNILPNGVLHALGQSAETASFIRAKCIIRINYVQYPTGLRLFVFPLILRGF